MPRIHEYTAVTIVSLDDICMLLPRLETEGWNVMGPITYLSYGALQGAILLRRDNSTENKHYTTLEVTRDPASTLLPAFRASCVCGWVGEVRVEQLVAETDAKEHRGE